MKSADLTPKFDLPTSDQEIVLPPLFGSTPSQTVGGWRADAQALAQGKIQLQAQAERILLGLATEPLTGVGIFLGKDGSDYEFRAGNPSGQYIHWDGSTLSIVGSITATTGTIGGFTIGTDYIRDTADSFGLASTVSGSDDVRFWAGATFANRATAPLRLYESGAIASNNITITGGSVAGSTITAASIAGSQIQAATISAANIVTGTITATEIANATITGTKIASATITSSNIASATITGSNIASATVTGTNIGSATITGSNIGSATVTGSNIASTTIVAGNIANGTITTSQISATAGITGGQIANATITGGNIGSTTITAANITNLTITASQIANLTITSGKVNTALMSYSHNLAFSVASSTQVNWASGTVTTSDGTSYTISSGNTGTMAARTYIYLDTAISTTVLQTTTTFGTAVGDGKMLIATAQNNTTEAVFEVFNGIGGMNLAGGNIVAGSITANEIAATTITAAKIASATITANEIAASTITGSNILTLNISGKNATFDTGTIGGFTMSATQLTATNFSVTSGAANTARLEVGTGSNTGGINSANGSSDIVFWAGATHANRATAPFRVTAGGALVATSATISGYVVSGKGAFGGDGSDGALSITSGTTTIDLGGAAIVTKNYSSISITGTGKLAFSNPHANGTIIILKSQGAVTITSSTNPAVDATGIGAGGGTAGIGGAGTSTAGGGGGGGAATAGSAGTQVGLQGNSGTAGTSYGAWIFVSSAGAGGFGGTSGAGAGGTSPLASSTVAPYMKVYVLPGGGGGGGSGGNFGGSLTGGTGSRGGGALYIECGGALNITSTLTAAGTAGGEPTGTQAGGGGGGGGGCIVILYNTLTANSGTYTVTGGAGGNVAGGRGGGSGGNGFSLVAPNTNFVSRR